MILFILAAFFAYKKALATGRSGVLWALIAAGIYIGTQILFALGIGLFLGLGAALFGWSETLYEDFSALISAGCIIASFVSLWLLFRYLDKVPPEEIYISPPSPPTFDGK